MNVSVDEYYNVYQTSTLTPCGNSHICLGRYSIHSIRTNSCVLLCRNVKACGDTTLPLNEYIEY